MHSGFSYPPPILISLPPPSALPPPYKSLFHIHAFLPCFVVPQVYPGTSVWPWLRKYLLGFDGLIRRYETEVANCSEAGVGVHEDLPNS